jgi:hypothetical protein
MLFRETSDVYCDNHMKHAIHCVGRMQNFSMLKRVVYTYSNHSAWKGLKMYWQHSAHIRFDLRGDAMCPSAVRANVLKHKATNENAMFFKSFIKKSQLIGYIKTDKYVHYNCIVQIWLAGAYCVLFKYVQYVQLGSVSLSNFELLYELSWRRQTGALTSQNFHWNSAFPGQ